MRWFVFGLLWAWAPWAAWAENLDTVMEAAIRAEQGARRNITLGAMFQEDFRQQDGVKELKNGILYRIEESGEGKTPKLSDRVQVWYVGRRVDGQIFDQTKEKETREFRLDQDVISGWQEVLPLMREGDQWEVVIPSHFAYGARGSPQGKIGPNETLIFRIKLVRVLAPGEKSKPPSAP